MSLLDGFTFDDIEYLVENNPYLRGYLHGYLAELVLMRKIETLPGVDSVTKIPDSDKKKGDLEVSYLGTTITIECKSISMGSVKFDEVTESWTGHVTVKNSDKRTMTIDGEDRALVNVNKGQFDILAVNCFAVNGNWDFLFVENRFLLERDDAPGFITSRVTLNPSQTPGVTDDIEALLLKVFKQKIANAS